MLEFLTSAGAEVAAETMKEATTEVVEKTIDDAVQVSFGKLTDGKYRYDERYLDWKDGVSYSEVNLEWIKKITDEISSVYGIYDVDVSKKRWKSLLQRFNNAMMTVGETQSGEEIKQLEYDPKLFVDIAREHGEDGILGVLSHEIGHEIYYKTGLFDIIHDYFLDPANKEKIEKVFKDVPPPKEGRLRSTYINEACADYIAGLTARLGKFDPEPHLSWYQTRPEKCTDGEHPGSSFRTEMFKRGYSRLDRGEEVPIFLRDFGDTRTMPYEKLDTLKKILEEDVINPILNGEIKVV